MLLHDLAMTAAAIIAAFYIRFEQSGLDERASYLFVIVPLFAAYAGVVFTFSQLYRSKWRFASLPDLFNIFRASSVLALSMLALDYVLLAPYLYGDFFFGKITIALYWLLQMFFLGGPRIAYRYFRYARSRHHAQEVTLTPSLVVGRADEVDALLRSIETGAVKRIRVAGILSPSSADRRQVVRGVEVAGTPDHLERVLTIFQARGIRIGRLILMPSALADDANPDLLVMRARRLGISTNRLPALDAGEPIRLAPINVDDLLVRPRFAIDHVLTERAIAGRSVVVTGGGGSIGSEICRRLVSYGAERLLIVENSEPNLHAITEDLNAIAGECEIVGRIADVRDRSRIHSLFEHFKPDLVYHAAALKHVPIVERDWAEGVKTNVFGTINVVDAARSADARATVLISTDKAVEPTSMLGATKRFAELYCQAIDAETASHGQRTISVRFGNVLGSNGSVVPKFRTQIEAGGPVTITHPDMVRYFMTVREACDLVLSATSHALSDEIREMLSVYVLKMGHPVRIRELAEKMIRMHGFEPNADIDIQYTGVRPGERIEEILFAKDERCIDTGVPGIVAASSVAPSSTAMRMWAGTIKEAVAKDDRTAAYHILADAVPDFQGKAA